MTETKKEWHKTDKILGYHIIQSFAPGEGTPKTIHELGKEFARRAFGERFEVVVATHLNTGCLHNHQCFFCDYCCAEMMIISIDNCFDRLYCNFYKTGRLNSEEVRLHCLERLEKLSKLRMPSNIELSGIEIRLVNEMSRERVLKTYIFV